MADESADLRQFMREMMVRADRVTDRVVRQLEANTRQIEELTRETDELTRAFREQHREQIAEMRAGREALFRVLDRLPPPREGGAPG